MDKKKCIVCAEEIEKAAQKCKICESFQNWRRHLNLSSVLLSLMLAFLSVIVVSAPPIYKLLQPSYSKLVPQSFYWTRDGLSLVIENKGPKPGFIHSCKLDLIVEGEIVQDFHLSLSPESKTRIVSGGSIQEYFYNINKSYFKGILENQEKYQQFHDKNLFEIQLRLELQNYKGDKNNNIWTAPAKDFFYVLKFDE